MCSNVDLLELKGSVLCDPKWKNPNFSMKDGFLYKDKEVYGKIINQTENDDSIDLEVEMISSNEYIHGIKSKLTYYKNK